MKIANVVYGLDGGGAGIAVNRINKVLNSQKKISKIITYQDLKINNKYYLFAMIYAYFICRKRYFSQLK